MHLNFTVQRQLSKNTTVTLAYVGTQGRKLPVFLESNPGDAGLCLSLTGSGVMPGTVQCGPNGEDQIYTRPNGSKVYTTRPNFSDVVIRDRVYSVEGRPVQWAVPSGMRTQVYSPPAATSIGTTVAVVVNCFD